MDAMQTTAVECLDQQPSLFDRLGHWAWILAPHREAKVRFADVDLLALSPHLKADLGLVDLADPLGRR